MHMGDALISPEVAGAMYVVTGGLIAYSSKKVSQDSDFPQRLPFAGIMGAFVFSAQMINFAIPGTGSSGHIGGGLLLAALLGPYAAILVITSVLLVQCLLFADGGLLALGCNIFNLGFWPAFVGLPIFLAVQKLGGSKLFRLIAAVCAVVISLEAGAFSVVLETLLSGRSELPFSYFSAFMLGIHFPIAVIEGFLTYAVIRLLDQINESGVPVTYIPQAASKRVYIFFALLALFIGAIGAWFASSKPDGLEWSVFKVTQAEELKESGEPVQNLFKGIQEKTALLPDYSLPEGSKSEAGEEKAPAAEPSWPEPSAGTSLSGLIGGVVTAFLVLLLGAAISRNKGSISGARS